MTGKAGKILFLEKQSSKIVPTCINLSIGGRPGVEAKRLSKFLEDPTFADGFD